MSIPLPEGLQPGTTTEQCDKNGEVFGIVHVADDGTVTCTAPPYPPGETYEEAIQRIVRAAPPLGPKQVELLRSIFADARRKRLGS